MSEQAQTQETNQPSPAEVATDILNRNVYLPVFINKLASDYNVHVRDENELRELLEIDQYLKMAQATDQNKYASVRSAFLSDAKALAAQQVGMNAPRARADEQLKQAAAQLVGNQTLRDAALIYGSAMREAAK